MFVHFKVTNGVHDRSLPSKNHMSKQTFVSGCCFIMVLKSFCGCYIGKHNLKIRRFLAIEDISSEELESSTYFDFDGFVISDLEIHCQGAWLFITYNSIKNIPVTLKCSFLL